MKTTESLGIWHQAELTSVSCCQVALFTKEFVMDASRDVKINVHQRFACVQVRIMIVSIYNKARFVVGQIYIVPS